MRVKNRNQRQPKKKSLWNVVLLKKCNEYLILKRQHFLFVFIFPTFLIVFSTTPIATKISQIRNERNTQHKHENQYLDT